jgi:hypothetical protein
MRDENCYIETRHARGLGQTASQNEIRCAGCPTHLIFLLTRNESAD